MTKAFSFSTSLFLTFFLWFVSFNISANPEDGKVISGNINIQQESPTKLGITQTTEKGIINWQKFNINPNEHTQFYQPSNNAVTLNRVVSDEPSKILGNLSANGKVFIINQNGILFGANSKVDVAGLVASVHDIKNSDFLDGKLNFSIPGRPNASVINEGNINIKDQGLAAFVAPSVQNSGNIVAKLGKVALASGNGFTLDLYGDELITLVVSDKIAKTAFNMDGKQLESFVDNSGTIQANGGYVVLTAKVARDVVNSVVNNSGIIETQSVYEKDGKIILSGGDSGVVKVTGSLDASSQTGKGGYIEVTGEKVGLFSGAKLDASGKTGGGTILVGGDYLGGEASDETYKQLGIKKESKAIQNAQAVAIAQNTLIKSDALESGIGGKVVVWSDDTTRAYGKISSTGVDKGGFIEVSGKKKLDINGIDIEAKDGTVLFDPGDVYIVDPRSRVFVDVDVTDFTSPSSNGNPSGTPTESEGELGWNTGNGGDGETTPLTDNTTIGIGIDFDPDDLIVKDTGRGESNNSVDAINLPFADSKSNTYISSSNIENILNKSISVIIRGTPEGPNVDSHGQIYVQDSIEKTLGGNARLSLFAADDITLSPGVQIASWSGKLGIDFDSDFDRKGYGNIHLSEGSAIRTNGGFVNLNYSYRSGTGIIDTSSVAGGEGVVREAHDYFQRSDFSFLKPTTSEILFTTRSHSTPLPILVSTRSHSKELPKSVSVLPALDKSVSVLPKEMLVSSDSGFISKDALNGENGKKYSDVGTTVNDKQNDIKNSLYKTSEKETLTQHIIDDFFETRVFNGLKNGYDSLENEITTAGNKSSASFLIAFDSNEIAGKRVENGLRGSYQVTLGALKTIFNTAGGLAHGLVEKELNTVTSSIGSFSNEQFEKLPQSEQDKILQLVQKGVNLVNSNEETKSFFETVAYANVGAGFKVISKEVKTAGKVAKVESKVDNGVNLSKLEQPKLTIREKYQHHQNMVDDLVSQLESKGYKVVPNASFKDACGIGRCVPDIIYKTPEGSVAIIEVKTGGANLSIRQSDIFPQIKDGSAVPTGKVAEKFGLKTGIPLKNQGYPDGIPIHIQNFPGVQ